MGWEDMVFLIGVVAVTCWICWPAYGKKVVKWNPNSTGTLQQLKITGDTIPKVNYREVPRGKVKGSEVRKGKFMINDKIWIELKGSALEKAQKADPDTYYDIYYEYANEQI